MVSKVGKLMLEIGADLVPHVRDVPSDYLAKLAKDPDVVDWLIGWSDVRRPSTFWCLSNAIESTS